MGLIYGGLLLPEIVGYIFHWRPFWFVFPGAVLGMIAFYLLDHWLTRRGRARHVSMK